MKFSNIILIISIIVWGILLGGIVYSHIVYFPVFLASLPGSAEVVTGKYGIQEQNFWMIIHPVLIALLLITLIANWKNYIRRKKILISIVVYAVIIIVSAVYFIPELIAFSESAKSSLPATEWQARAKNWMTYSIIRGIIIFVAIFPLFMALLKPAVANLSIRKRS